MAGKGVRLYPHTINTLKPFLIISGKTILNRFLYNFQRLIKFFSIKEIIFIIPYSKKKIEEKILNITHSIIGMNPIVYYQTYPIGTADALLKAKKNLSGPLFIAYPDSLFYNNSFEKEIYHKKNVIWTKQVKDPHLFGVIQCDSYGKIIHFIEKPRKYQSNLAMVGCYYFHDGFLLMKELEYLLKNKIKNKEEYQLTSVLENMRKKGEIFINKNTNIWIDFGNKNKIIDSHSKLLSIESKELDLISKKAILKNSLIIKPCYIGDHTFIENSIIGPFVSIEQHAIIKNSNIKKSIIQKYTNISSANLTKSIFGKFSYYKNTEKEINIGDYSIFN